MNSRKRLVLFDIDGTLISTNGIAREHFAAAIEEVFQIRTSARTHDFAGKMDTQIYREILDAAGIRREEMDAGFGRFVETFYRTLSPHLTSDTITVHPGIRKLLEALQADSDITLALLTGNLEEGARLKLSPVGLNKYFPFGAFGNDGLFRHELPRIAVQRAREATGCDFTGRQIVIIGDTPNDIQCGQGLHVKTIAVATGVVNYETLASFGPDYLYKNLAETKRVLEAIYRDT